MNEIDVEGDESDNLLVKKLVQQRHQEEVNAEAKK